MASSNQPNAFSRPDAPGAPLATTPSYPPHIEAILARKAYATVFCREIYKRWQMGQCAPKD